VTDAGQVLGADPLFSNAAANDFRLVAGSPCVDQAVALDPSCVPAHVPSWEFAAPAGGVARLADEAMDLGAFELASPVGVAPALVSWRAHLDLAPNPFSSAIDVRWAGPDGPKGDLEVFDLAGRRVARVPASAAGAWRWIPAAGMRRGVYFLRAPGARAVAAYFR
jgi:hypothetical protein